MQPPPLRNRLSGRALRPDEQVSGRVKIVAGDQGRGLKCSLVRWEQNFGNGPKFVTRAQALPVKKAAMWLVHRLTIPFDSAEAHLAKTGNHDSQTNHTQSCTAAELLY